MDLHKDPPLNREDGFLYLFDKKIGIYVFLSEKNSFASVSEMYQNRTQSNKKGHTSVAGYASLIQ